MEVKVRSIQKDGLVWAAAKLVAVGFGIKKLQINLVVEDEKVSIDELQAQIEEFEDYVQSTDVVSTVPPPRLALILTFLFPGRYAEVVVVDRLCSAVQVFGRKPKMSSKRSYMTSAPEQMHS